MLPMIPRKSVEEGGANLEIGCFYAFDFGTSEESGARDPFLVPEG